MKIKITKLQEVDNPKHPNNIPTGYDVERSIMSEYFINPTIGERFNVGGFSSSMVVEIIDSNTFKTLNSIYRWVIIEEGDN